jgi:hypothetical protein
MIYNISSDKKLNTKKQVSIRLKWNKISFSGTIQHKISVFGIGK